MNTNYIVSSCHMHECTSGWQPQPNIAYCGAICNTCRPLLYVSASHVSPTVTNLSSKHCCVDNNINIRPSRLIITTRLVVSCDFDTCYPCRVMLANNAHYSTVILPQCIVGIGILLLFRCVK